MSMIRSLSLSFLSFLVIVSLTGCGNGSGSVSPAGSPAASGPGGGVIPTGVVKLSWDVPTNPDGTPFTGIVGYKVYYGTSPETYSSSIDVGMTTSYSVNGLAPGTYYFTVTDYDSAGNESDYSNEGSKTII